VSRYPDWASDGRDWPNRDASRFVRAGGYEWHVQQMGSGPACLLLHGTGAATHSWRDVAPRLAQQFTVIAIDLPGHGFTRGSGQRPTLESMARAITALLDELGVTPTFVVGHSAGAAIGTQLLLDRNWRAPLVGFAPALMPFPGLAAKIFPSLAKMLFTNPLIGVILSRIARSPGQTALFLKRSTGSQIDARGEQCYTRLFGRSGHCDGAIRMMANWQLEPLRDRLGQLAAPVLLVYCEKDAAIAKSAISSASALIPVCGMKEMRGVGHLGHEENPQMAADMIIQFAAAHVAG
jgi:magnesium chelatase accessory protein